MYDILPIVPAILIEKTIPSLLNYLDTFVGNQLTTCMGLFLGSQFCSIDLYICLFSHNTTFSLLLWVYNKS